MPVQLNPQANAALAEIIRKNNGQLPAAVEQHLQSLETQAAPVSLSLDDVEKVLRQAMPERKEWIDQACSIGSGYHADGKNARFLTQILSAKIEKINEVQAGTSNASRRVDPMFAEFTMDPKAQSMLLFNARNVDRAGNALLMKIVMRMSPKVEAVVTQAENEIETLVKKTVTEMQQRLGNNASYNENELRASWGLPTETAPDHNIQQQFAANLESWAPGSTANHQRVTELLQQISEAKQRYIDGQLPELDLKRYRMEPADAKPDVTLVGAKATYVKSVDFNEAEFSFGDPLKQISIAASGRELSSSVLVRPENEQFNRAWNDPTNQAGRRADYDAHTVGDDLDRQAVVTFDDRIRLEVRAKEGHATTPGAWLDDPNALGAFDVKLHVDRGLLFEPGANAAISLMQTNVVASVPADDALLKGNAPSATAVDTTSYAAQPMRFLLQSNVTRTSWAQPNRTDQAQQSVTVASLVYANAQSIDVGAAKLAPLGDLVLKQGELAANKMKLDAVPIGDDDKDSVKVRLTLDEGFLSAQAGKADLKGWTVQVGYFDANNAWVEEKRRTIGDATCSKPEHFTFDIDGFEALQKPKDAAGNGAKHVEIRLYNADGVPAERIKIPFREVVWGDE